MVAKNVHHGSMLDEDRLEGRDMARDVVLDHAKVPLAKETLQRFCKVWTHRPRCPKSRGTWCGFSLPPDNGVVDGLK